MSTNNEVFQLNLSISVYISAVYVYISEVTVVYYIMYSSYPIYATHYQTNINTTCHTIKHSISHKYK